MISSPRTIMNMGTMGTPVNLESMNATGTQTAQTKPESNRNVMNVLPPGQTPRRFFYQPSLPDTVSTALPGVTVTLPSLPRA